MKGMIILLRKEDYDYIEGCLLNKTLSTCDPTKCYKCGWNKTEFKRRKEKINKGLVSTGQYKGIPVYGIKINDEKKRGKKKYDKRY